MNRLLKFKIAYNESKTPHPAMDVIDDLIALAESYGEGHLIKMHILYEKLMEPADG